MDESIYGALGDPLSYPCVPVPQPTLVLNGKAVPIDWDWPDHRPVTSSGAMDVDTLLIENGSMELEGRVAQVAFGANRNLENILWKFGNYGQDVSRDLVVIPGYIQDCEVVACNLGYWGYLYASLLMHRPPLLDRPYLLGTVAPVCVLFLDHEQMQCIHLSEGVVRNNSEQRPQVNCDVAHIETTLINDVVIDAQLYALSLPYLSFDGYSPITFHNVETVNRSGSVKVMSQIEMFDELIHRLALDVPSDLVQAPGRWLAGVLREDKLKGSLNKKVLYEEVREQIIRKLCLRDEDGAVRSGNDGLSRVMPPEGAWSLTPTLAQQSQI